MSSLISSTLMALVTVCGIYIVLGVMLLMIRSHQKKNRLPVERSKLIRMPAQHLSQQIMDVVGDMLGIAAMLTAVIPMPLVFVGIEHFMPLTSTTISLGVVALFAIIFGVTKVRGYTRTLFNLKLGRDAELAAASELMKLQAHGYQVFHDVQADGFNIDHLAVGPQGVFAIETKGRHKRVGDDGRVKKAYAMAFENGVLNFPSWQERDPIDQAQRQAKWVNEWLVKATGLTKLQTMPVLTFPGWWVEAKSKPPFPIVNHKQLPKAILSMRVCALNSAEISQVCYQVIQRCTQGE